METFRNETTGTVMLGMSAMETLGMRIRIRLGMSTNNLVEMGKQMISRDVSK